MEASTGLTFSTDVLGIFAHPADVTNLYEAAGFNTEQAGIEMVLMPPQISILNSLSRKPAKGFNLNGVHGKLGTKEISGHKLANILDFGKIMAADALLPPISGYHPLLPFIPAGLRVEMIGQFTNRDIYFNVHNDSVTRDFPAYLEYAYFATNSHLSIENGGRKGDIRETSDLVNCMRQLGATETTGTFDLVHAVKEQSDGNVGMESINKVWGSVLSQIGDVFRHLHLPIGSFSENGDSLPILAMTSNGNHPLVKDLADVIREKEIAITFENQHNLLLGANVAKETERLKRIRGGLLECGFEV